MSTLFTSNPLMFISGIICGTTMTLLWTRLIGPRVVNLFEKKSTEYATGTIYAPCKLVLAVRNDLKMGKGKVAAQCSHAALMAHESSRQKSPALLENWKLVGQPKIVVKIDSEKEMLSLAEQARKNLLLVSIVHDAGRTQIPSGTKTVIAVGPGPEDVIDKVTGHLKLY